MNLEGFINLCGEVKDHHRVSMKRLYDSFKPLINDSASEQPKEPRMAALKKLGLTAEDGFFIRCYTGSCSSWINADKRNCNDHCCDCKWYFADLLEQALRKIPVFEGKVWRWEEADEKLKKFNWFKDHIGFSVRIPYFLSTSKDDITAKSMLWEITTIIEGHARDISEISNAPCEQEVLFIPDSKFKIIGVKDDNRTIIMQELSPDIEVEFDLCRIYYYGSDDINSEMVVPGMFD
jgi:ADP-ribosyltransferase exoenzyme